MARPPRLAGDRARLRTGLECDGARTAELGGGVDWQVADATSAELGKGTYDLVLVLYLHLSRERPQPVLSGAADAVAPGGLLLVLGHDRDSLVRGVGGPRDESVLYDTSRLRAAADSLVIERLEQVERTVDGQAVVDCVLLARRA